MPHGNKDGYISRKRRAERRNQPLTTSRQREAALRNIKTVAVAATSDRARTPGSERLENRPPRRRAASKPRGSRSA